MEALLLHAFPSSVAHDLAELSRLDWTTRHGAAEPYVVQVDGETMQVPRRIHFDTRLLEQASRLSPRHKRLALYFFTRHNDGFVRQACLEEVIGVCEPWQPPYVLHLLGEAVVEIIEVIHKHLDSLDREIYARFIRTNMSFYETIRHRVRSYWDAYYRARYPVYASYPGALVIAELDRLISS